jgi:hypothetical protein
MKRKIFFGFITFVVQIQNMQPFSHDMVARDCWECDQQLYCHRKSHFKRCSIQIDAYNSWVRISRIDHAYAARVSSFMVKSLRGGYTILQDEDDARLAAEYDELLKATTPFFWPID